jgi:hypothetical protein
MRIAFSLVLTVHALIHLMGFVKAFELAPLAQLKLAISRPMGVLWLIAVVLLLAAVALLFIAPRWFWLAGLVGLAVSQTAIMISWSNARFGTVPNVVLLLAVIYGSFAWGPFGLRAEYDRLVRDGISRMAKNAQPQYITETDLAGLPLVVQRYLRFAGVVETPRVQGFRARMTGRIRGSATAPWMPFVAEQYNFYGPPRRYFWIEATRGGLPLDGLHVYGEADASMRVRLLSILQVVHVKGAQMMKGETVTVLNDMCFFAPGSLIDPSIRWREVDARTVEATYTNGPHTVHAELVFDDSGALVNFWSDDRPALAPDGKTLLSQRWSTPVRGYQAMGPHRLIAGGEARYAASDGEYAYIELEILEVNTEIQAP